MNNHNYPPNSGQSDDAANDEADADLEDVEQLTEEDLAAAMAPPDIAALEEEAAMSKDRLLRMAAELENTRRRGEREKSEAGRYAIANFARDLLSVADNFERALAAAPNTEAEESAMSQEAISGLITGVRMTEKELLKTLDRHGIKRIDPVGEKFDPNVHQAVAQAPTAGIPSGHVAQVAQTGFVLGDRVLRAAMVIVSTGEPANGDGDAPGDAAKGAHLDTSA